MKYKLAVMSLISLIGCDAEVSISSKPQIIPTPRIVEYISTKSSDPYRNYYRRVDIVTGPIKIQAVDVYITEGRSVVFFTDMVDGKAKAISGNFILEFYDEKD